MEGQPGPGDLDHLQAELGHRFAEERLLQTALTHTSYWNEYPHLAQGDNQRLEFLGDAVLDLLVADWLFRRFPQMSEGDMTALRATLVREESLAAIADSVHLGSYLLLGRGEEEGGGRARRVNLCGALEAVMGALYLDGGLEAVCGWILGPLERELDRAHGTRDAKSLLQEWSQGRHHVTPTYRTVAEEGPDHAKHFTVEVSVGGEPYGVGTGPSKQAAAQAAAQQALDRIAGHNDWAQHS